MTPADIASRPDRGRGTCPACGRDYQLTRRGTIRIHTYFDQRQCQGSGLLPKEARL